MTRRDFLPLLIVGVGVSGFVYTGSRFLALSTTPGSQFVRPRFRARKPGNPVGVAMPPGFYFNERSKIVHYVDEKGFLKRVQRIDSRRLSKMSAPPLLGSSAHVPRVDLGSASVVFENLARARLVAGDPDAAAALLINGIRHDLLRLNSRLKTRPTLAPGSVRPMLPSGFRPSFRIYDLLAAESVRSGNQQRLDGMVVVLQSQPREIQAFFESRLAKWTANSSAWYKKWRGR